MGMVVQHNMNALNAYNKLNANVTGLRKASEKLSSGYRINRAGDDAAGLAISEKMRSQIRGLNQAVRNSQDGINMIQTFEGAAQETHSILQRMKELASESANGTYDNATDRAAIQLEFEQLNDELNQIADTDFNGTVVLNGGEMADGLKQVDGNFDYRLKAGQVADENAARLAEAQAAAQDKIDKAQVAFNNAEAAYTATKGRDLCLSGSSVQWNTVDDNKYTSAVAEDLFGKVTTNVQLDTDTAETAHSLSDAGVKSFNVQFVFDGTNWKIGTDTTLNAAGTKSIEFGDTTISTGAWYVNDKGEAKEVDLTGATNFVDAKITTTANGGFIVNDSVYGNAILATSGAKKGDVVTLTYTNEPIASIAPTNIGMDEETLKDNVGLASAPKLELTDVAMDKTKMDQDMMNALTKLDKTNVTLTYTEDGIAAKLDTDLTVTDMGVTGNDRTFAISYKDKDGKDVQIANITVQNAHGKSTVKAQGSQGSGKTVTKNTQATDTTATTYNLTYKEGKWVNDADGSEFDDAAAAAATGITGTTVASLCDAAKAQEGDKMSFTTEAVAAGGTATNDIVPTYTKSTNASYTAAAAATKDDSVEFTYNGTNWVNANNVDYATWAADAAGGQAFGGAADVSGAAIGQFVDATTTPTIGDKLTLSIADGSKVAKASVTPADATQGTVTFGVALDEGNFDPSAVGPTIDPSTAPNGIDATSIDKAYETTKAALQEAKASYPKTLEDLGDIGGVTKADAFDNSTARMTYTDNITLQTGARTKDAVNFTFKYNTDGTADMGELKANLNLSAREDGLNTANLSLANQKDANYAIDQIDKAINKTSMVRATFGAIQNRLEHKITNLTTTSENLQEAESSIRDTDMASEMMNYTKFNILQQAAQSMLAQANQQPQSILQLLG